MSVEFNIFKQFLQKLLLKNTVFRKKLKNNKMKHEFFFEMFLLAQNKTKNENIFSEKFSMSTFRITLRLFKTEQKFETKIEYYLKTYLTKVNFCF